MSHNLRIASINISGIRNESRRKLIFDFCKGNNLDIIGLQEVTFSTSPILEAEYVLISNPGPRKIGTAVLVKRGLQIEDILMDPDGRVTSVSINNNTYIVIYAPSGRSARGERTILFTETIPAYVLQAQTHFVMMGDLNSVDSH